MSLYSCRCLLGLGCVLALSVGGVPTNAQATLYTNLADFAAASTNLTTLAFSSLVAQNSYVYNYSPTGFTLSGVQFVGPQNNGGFFLGAIGPNYGGGYLGWNGNPTVLQGPPGASVEGIAPGLLDIILPANTTAVAANFYTIQANGLAPGNSPVSFTLSTGQTFAISAPTQPEPGFAGFVSNTPITSIEVMTTDTTFPNLTNFTFGQNAAVPESSSLVICSLAGVLAGASWLRRRR